MKTRKGIDGVRPCKLGYTYKYKLKGEFMGFLKHLAKNMYRYGHYDTYHHEKHNHDRRYPDSNETGYPRSTGIFLYFKNLVRRNKKLVYLFFALAGLTILLLVVLAAALIPLTVYGIGYLYDHGIKGIVDILLSLLKTVWEGAGK